MTVTTTTAGRDVQAACDDQSQQRGEGHLVLAVADILTGHGFDVQDPERAAVSLLRVMNVPGALCDLAFHVGGRVEIEYRLCDPCQAEPAQMARIVTILLGAAHRPASRPDRGRMPAPHGDGTVCGAACRMLADRGLRIQLTPRVDQFRYEVFTVAAVTNPNRPDRGTARIFGDNSIQWAGDLADPARNRVGLDPREVADIVARALD